MLCQTQGFYIIDDHSHIPNAAALLALSPGPSPILPVPVPACASTAGTGAAAVAQAGLASGEGSSSKVRELEVVSQVKQILLRTIFKRIIINPQGESVDCDPHSTFAYLSALTSNCAPLSDEECGSEQVRLGAYNLNKASQSSLDLEDLLAGSRFEQRSKLAELLSSYVESEKARILRQSGAGQKY